MCRNCPEQPAAQRARAGTQDWSSAQSRGARSAEGSSVRGPETDLSFCLHPRPHPKALQLPEAKAELLPSLCPPGHHSLAWGRGGPDAPPTVPVLPAGAPDQHGGGDGRREGPQVAAGPVSRAQAPLEKLWHVPGEVRRPACPSQSQGWGCGRRCRCSSPMGWDRWRPAARAQGLGRWKNSPKTEQKT